MHIARLPTVLTLLVCTRVGHCAQELPWPPILPGGKEIVTDCSPDFLKPSHTIQNDIEIAKAPPTIEFMYYPGQTYKGIVMK